jgi:hypothetical protein
MLGSFCATLPDVAAYERVITLILWVLLRAYVSGGQTAAPVDIIGGFRDFRSFLLYHLQSAECVVGPFLVNLLNCSFCCL